MEGLMMDVPLLVRDIAERAGTTFGDREIVTRTADGVERTTYGEVLTRARRLASALQQLGVQPGDRIATFAWNSSRHLELYFAVPAMGCVLHTLNIRLFEDDLRYIVGHAEDRIIFVDASLAQLMPQFDGVEREVVLRDGPGEREGALDYEELIAGGDPEFAFPDLDEHSAAAMCFTSGTTGRPKGVVYTHRGIVLHSLVALGADSKALRHRDTILPIVPMFHANAWGLPYTAAMCGAKLVLPGAQMDPRSLADLIASEQVTWSAAVPTVWQGILQLDPPPDLSSLREIVSGGSALPESLARAYDERFGVPIIQGWGMTETGPLCSLSRPAGGLKTGEDYDIRLTQGRVQPLVQMRLDEEAGGEVQVRGPYIASAYYEDETGADKFTEDGWLRTGDVAEMHGTYVRLVDRTKDLVKSGGEWISSVELENHIMGHPDVVEAAVIAVPDERWTERPCACVVLRDGAEPDADAIRDHLRPLVAKWWVPERIEFIDEVPKTSVGKFDKKVLRGRFAQDDDGGSKFAASPALRQA